MGRIGNSGRWEVVAGGDSGALAEEEDDGEEGQEGEAVGEGEAELGGEGGW